MEGCREGLSSEVLGHDAASVTIHQPCHLGGRADGNGKSTLDEFEELVRKCKASADVAWRKQKHPDVVLVCLLCQSMHRPRLRKPDAWIPARSAYQLVPIPRRPLDKNKVDPKAVIQQFREASHF